jgi:hypothetical protein
MVRRSRSGEQLEHGDARRDPDLGSRVRDRLDVGGGRAAERLPLDLVDRVFGLRYPALAQQVTHRFRHVAAHEEQQHRRHDADNEQRPPAEIRYDGEAQRRGHHEPDRKRRHDVPGHAAADAPGAELGGERQRHRHLAAEPEIGQEPEDAEGSHVPRGGDEAGEQRAQADRCLERGAPADVVGERSPEQRAQERADEADRGQQSGLRRAEAELARDRRQRRPEQGEIGGIEHDAEEGQDEEIAMPLRERQALEPGHELGGFLLGLDHRFPPSWRQLARTLP